MSAIAQALTAALLHFIWQGTLVAFLLWVALFALRNRPAQSRYLSGLAALIVMVLLPVVTAVLEYTAPISKVTSAQPAVVVEPVAAVVNPVAPGVASQWLPAALEPLALPLWSLGVLIFALRAVWGCGHISTMRRRAVPAAPEVLARAAEIAARLGLGRPVEVLMTALVGSPSVIGWFRPVILLPPAMLLGLTTEQLEAVLAHELAHIGRHDSLVNAAQILVETLLFYHPAVWWTSARIREERELCCDDLAVESCGDALCYARALTKLERLRVTAPALAMGITGDPLGYRIRRLMGVGGRGNTPSKLPGVLALVLGLACLGANVHWARGQEQKTVIPQNGPVSEAAKTHELSLTSEAPEKPSPLAEEPAAQDDQQDQRRVELEALRQRVRELEEQLSSRGLDDQRAAEKLRQQTMENLEAQGGRLSEQRAALELQLQNLRMLMTDSQARLNNLRIIYKDGYPDVEAAKNRLAEVENSIANVEREMKLRELDLRQSGQNVDAQRDLEQQRVREAEDLRRLAQLAHALSANQQSVTTWTVKSIDIVGLSTQSREALAGRLPVKVGSKLAAGSVDAIAAALKDVDDHLTFTITLGSNGDAMIRITRPKI